MSESSKVTVNYFCIGAFFIFIGCVLICCLGFIIVLPFETTRLWPLVNCKVVNSSYSPHFCSCDEGFSENYATEFEDDSDFSINDKLNKSSTTGIFTKRDSQNVFSISQVSKFRNNFYPLPHLTCQSKYPCLQIFVQYEIELISKEITSARNAMDNFNYESSHMNYKNTSNNSYIYNESDFQRSTNHSESGLDESFVDQNEVTSPINQDKNEKFEGQVKKLTQIAQLYRSWDDSFYSKCSLTECGDDVWNLKENRRFKREWGRPKEEFKCFYNPNKPKVVIIDKTPASAVLHAILWPVLCLLAGTSLWICLCCGCCKAGDKDSNCKEKYKIVA